MAKRKDVDVATQLLNLGLNKQQMALFFNSIHEKYWADSVELHKQMEIVRNALDEKDKLYLLLRGFDKKGYDVNIEIIEDKFVSFCSCSNKEEKGCEHAGCALIYKLLKEKDNDFNKKLCLNGSFSEEVTKSDLSYFKNLFPTENSEEKQYMIYFNFEDFDLDRQILSIERGIIKKDGRYGAPVKFQGKQFDTGKWDLSKNVRKVLDFINGDNYGMKYSTGGFQKSRFYDVNTDLMMPSLKKVYLEEKEVILNAKFAKETFQIVWDIRKNKEKYILEPMFMYEGKKTSMSQMKLLDLGNTRLWVFDSETRTFFEYKYTENLNAPRGIIRYPKRLELDETELKQFFKRYYQKIVDDFEISLSKDLKRNEKSVIPSLRIYLEKSGYNAKLKLKFNYAGQSVDYFSSNKELILVEGDAIYDIHRDMEYEDELIEKLNDHHIVTHEEKDEFVLDCDLIDFVTEEVPKIVELGIEIMGEERLFGFNVIKTKPKMDIKINSNSDWFEIKGDIKFGKDSIEMSKVMELLFRNKRFVELSDGKRAVIPKEWVKGLKAYSGFFDINKEKIKISKCHVGILNEIINLSSNNVVDNSAKKIIDSFKKISKIQPIEVPNEIKANLREYQKTGYYWLNFLYEIGFNGILADDMGLGKTIQTLTLLQNIKNTKKSGPFLIVVPTSLVFNWKSEIEKFSPNIKSCVYHGFKRKKKDFEELYKNNDLIITTYGVLRNDLEIFSKNKFEYIVLDEAHIIKNPQSISAKSVFALNAKSKLVISGTPIQNNLTELWSLFNFLNPGYLGSYESFKENFVNPIENAKDTEINASLKKLINPFLLRRTKKIISDELPEKTEIVLKETFSDKEREIYDNWKEYYKNEIKNTINEKGIGGSKIKILEGLMKLRQICLHPKLIDSEYKFNSSKLDLILMEVEKILSEGHKILIFSSFVKMLNVVKEEFEKQGIRYSYLDGQTKDREKVVSNFQNSIEPEAFLISIKAGGVGLNLTEADYVFILDPWWNPAVESQAMDRTHRIGQKNKVFVYKTIIENTIEEKILKLQESKKKLVEDLIVEDEGSMKNITFKDIEELFK